MNPIRYRCVAKRPFGSDLDDMRAPVQLFLEAVGERPVDGLNRFRTFAPVLPAPEADLVEVGADYEITLERVAYGRPRATA